MKRIPDGSRWLVAAAAIAAGVPLIVLVGLVVTLQVSLLVGRFLPEWAFALLWLAGSFATCVPVWFLVRRCVRDGGWRALALGAGAGSTTAIGSYALGAVTQAVRPGANGMAGTAWVFLAYVLGLSLIATLATGAAVILVDTRRGRATVPDEPAVADPSI